MCGNRVCPLLDDIRRAEDCIIYKLVAWLQLPDLEHYSILKMHPERYLGVLNLLHRSERVRVFWAEHFQNTF